uniref:Peptidase S1 domain-containing protein n=1 Tax=Salarias fasciatus TaxID=181472 RepID=A0A672IML9_SALFA
IQHVIKLLSSLLTIRAVESNIVAGRVAKPHSRPYMASLQFNGAHICGGILIREDFVLTAGDSGGPLICNKKVEGITAYTKEDDCSNPRYPHVFTKVNYFSSWIKKVMKPSVNVA